jgi:adenylate kinase family enzyme
MDKLKHKRIAIIGCAGSGKTTLALKLKEKLSLPLHHLDQYYWKPNWERVDFEAFSKAHDNLCDQNEWIIEGPYLRTLYYRVTCADTIIFLDLPRRTCMWSIIRRSITNYRKVLPGSTANCKQRLFSFKYLEFLHWVWNFNKRYHKSIMQVLSEFAPDKQIYILNSFDEIDTICLNLT